MVIFIEVNYWCGIGKVAGCLASQMDFESDLQIAQVRIQFWTEYFITFSVQSTEKNNKTSFNIIALDVLLFRMRNCRQVQTRQEGISPNRLAGQYTRTGNTAWPVAQPMIRSVSYTICYNKLQHCVTLLYPIQFSVVLVFPLAVFKISQSRSIDMGNDQN